MTQTDPGFRALATVIARMQKDLRSQGRASQAAFRSVEASDGPVRYYGSDGEVLGEIVAGPQGVEVRPAPTVAPLTPTAPDAVGVQGGIVVKYDGTFIGGNWSHTISHVEIHRASVAQFTPNDQTLISTFSSYWGGEFWTAATPVQGEQYFRLVTVDRAGNRSAPSGVDSAVALATHVGSDGEAPETSPAPVVRGGVGALFVSWTPVVNEDPVDYYVHISTVDDFTPSPATLVTETAASSAVIKTLPGGGALEYDVIYYIKIVAEDVDGAAPASVQGGASMMQVTGEDIAVNYVYAGNILADQIEGGTIRSAVTIAGLFQTATAGGRVEMGPFGIRVYDANGIDVNVDLAGAVNRFRGSIDAVDIIIRDALQMFGKNNMMGVGAELTLSSSTSAPAQPPTMSWEYEQQAVIPADYFTAVGGHMNNNGANLSWVGRFLNHGIIVTASGGKYQWPNLVPNPANPSFVTSEFVPISSIRIAKADNNADRLVILGHDWTKMVNGYPELWVRIYDDSPLIPDGSVPPVLKTQFKFANWSWTSQYRLGRMLNGGGWRNWFVVAEQQFPSNSAIPVSVRYVQYAYQNNEINVTNMGENTLNALYSQDVNLAGITYGSSSALGIETGGSHTCMVIHTTQKNLVMNLTLGQEQFDANWETTYTAQDYSIVGGGLAANVVDRFYSMNYANLGAQKIFKYAKNFKLGSRVLWASYAWRGEANKPAFLTEDSGRTPINYRRGATLKITVPSLPAPIAGVGQPRDPNTDPYGWVYYIGQGTTEPLNSQMFRQPTQPTMVPGVPLAQAAITLDVYPTLSGNNPVLSGTFPAATPARLRSTGNDSSGEPLLLIDGTGLIKGATFKGHQDAKEAFLGRPFDQLFYSMRAPQAIIGGGRKLCSFDPSTTIGKVIWNSQFLVMNAGFDPTTAVGGTFQIVYPPVGTSIPVHYSTSRNAVVAASDGIPLRPYESLWYELPFGSSSASQAGRFHVVGRDVDDGYNVPPGWVMIVGYSGEFPYFHWADGTVDTGWIAATKLNGWLDYGTVPNGGARYRFLNGHTSVELALRTGTANSVMFNIPANYRPGSEIQAYGRSSDGISYDGVDVTTINSNGNLTATARTNYRFMQHTFAASL